MPVIKKGGVTYGGNTSVTYNTYKLDLESLPPVFKSAKLEGNLLTFILTDGSTLAITLPDQAEIDESVIAAEVQKYLDSKGVGAATETSAGVVKPDGKTITVDSNGTISVTEKGVAEVVEKYFEVLPKEDIQNLFI